MNDGSFDRVASVYDQTRALPAHALQRISDTLAGTLRAVSQTPHVVEVGIGTGRIAIPLLEHGVHITGIDVAPKMLAQLRRKRRDISTVLADAMQLPFRRATFDAALFIHVLHLVPSPDDVLRRAAEVVRPGGLIIYGGDDRGPGPHADAGVLLDAAARAVVGADLTNRRRYLDALRRAEAVIKVTCASYEHVPLAEWTERGTAREILERLRARVDSNTWRITQSDMSVIIDRATPDIERLFGGLDRVHESTRSVSVMVGRLPR